MNLKIESMDGRGEILTFGILPPQIVRYDVGEHNTNAQHSTEYQIRRVVAPPLEKFTVKGRERDAKNLHHGIQYTGRRALWFWVGQLGRKLEAHRQIARHEKSRKTGFVELQQKYDSTGKTRQFYISYFLKRVFERTG